MFCSSANCPLNSSTDSCTTMPFLYITNKQPLMYTRQGLGQPTHPGHFPPGSCRSPGPNSKIRVDPGL